MKNIFAKWKYKIREVRFSYLRKYYSIEAKLRYPFVLSAITLFSIIEIFILILYMFLFLQVFKIFHTAFFENIIMMLPKISDDMNKQLVFSQISVTFLILSLFSLISNLKKEKVLGTSIYSIAFSKSLISNILFLAPFIFLVLFLNLYLLMNDSSSEIILFLFLSAVIALTILILKIIVYTNFPRLTRDKIFSIYYLENKRIIKKHSRKGLNPTYELSNNLFTLVEDTTEKILRNDIEYRRNMVVFERLANLTLYNHGKVIQENYTEFSNKDDIILLWSNCILELIKSGNISDALIQHNKMVRVFLKNEVVISSHQIGDQFKNIMDFIITSKDSTFINQNEQEIIDAMRLSVMYCYFIINNDFSYTRLGKLKDNLLHIWGIYGSFFSDYYKLLNKLVGENNRDASKRIYNYFEQIRMMSHDITSPFHQNFRQLNSKWYNLLFKDNKLYDGELATIGIPLSALLIEIIKDEKKGRLLYFLVNFNNNSIYFACLIVLGKLTVLMQRTKDTEELVKVKKYIKLLMAKLLTWDSYKIKYNTHILYEIYIKEKLRLPYSDIWFFERHFDALKNVNNVIEMKRHNIKIDSNKIKNDTIRELYNLSKDINEFTLTREAKRQNSKAVKELGILNELF
ncbi:MAG: hypothetical protein ACE3JQ_04270 [Paenisporosarcina sp.]